MAWLILILAGALEVVWANRAQAIDGFTRLVPAAVTVTAMLASIGLLSLAMRALPLRHRLRGVDRHRALGAFAVGIPRARRGGDAAASRRRRARPGRPRAVQAVRAGDVIAAEP